MIREAFLLLFVFGFMARYIGIELFKFCIVTYRF